MHKLFPRNTRERRRIVFKTDRKEGNVYKHSPYFVGTKLWDTLSIDTIGLPDIFSFNARLKDRQQEVRAVLVVSRYIRDYPMPLEVLFMYHIPLYTLF